MTVILGSPPSVPPVARGNVYLPIIAQQTDPVAEFSRLLVADPRQQRTSLELCPALQQAAIWRAHGLANGDPWDHVDKDGVTPNEYARRAGCVLPDDYNPKGNNVESLVAGSADAIVMFNALAASPKHSDHIFGRGWFRSQRHFGVAMCAGGRWGWYWCVILGECLGQVSGE